MNRTTRDNDLKIQHACGDDNKSYIFLAHIKLLIGQKEIPRDEYVPSASLSAHATLNEHIQCTSQFVGTLLGKLNIPKKIIDGQSKWSMAHLTELVEQASLVHCNKEAFKDKISGAIQQFFGLSNKGKNIGAGYVVPSSNHYFIPFNPPQHFQNYHNNYWNVWYKCSYTRAVQVLNEALATNTVYENGCLIWTGDTTDDAKSYALLGQSKAEGLPTRIVSRLSGMVMNPAHNLGMNKEDNQIYL